MRFELEPALHELSRPTGPNGELEVWNAAAIAFEGAILTMLEADPEASVSADLSSWIEPAT